jgi:predicted GIY-YIG superfamily endonuclease
MAWVYILRCSDGSYYTGSTENLEKRLAEHHAAHYDGYTATRRPVTLAYTCELPTPDDAFRRERQIKGWARKKKEALIQGDWEALVKYSRSREHPSTGSG